MHNNGQLLCIGCLFFFFYNKMKKTNDILTTKLINLSGKTHLCKSLYTSQRIKRKMKTAESGLVLPAAESQMRPPLGQRKNNSRYSGDWKYGAKGAAASKRNIIVLKKGRRGIKTVHIISVIPFLGNCCIKDDWQELSWGKSVLMHLIISYGTGKHMQHL